MGALYGILGDAEHTELWALGNRLAHRGREAAEWSPGREVLLGIRGPRRIIDAQEHGPVAFEGAIDNRIEIAGLLGRRGGESVGPAHDAGLVFELIDSFGPEGLGRLAGQFAVAFWHGPDRRLLLARDPIGHAPLYFTITRERLVFASEYKALLALEGVAARPRLDALQVIHATGWSAPGLTCLEDIHPVAPGSYLEVRAGRCSSRRYWSIPAARGGDHSTQVRETLLGTLRRQTLSYGRIGISLDCGLGSALIAAGVRAVADDREIHTFSVGHGAEDRELSVAARLARELSAFHHPVALDPDDLATLLPWMVWHLEEPVGQEELAFQFAAAREAARHVSLVVNGFSLDGLFAGVPPGPLGDFVFRLPGLRRPLEELQDYVERGVPPSSFAGRVLKAVYSRGRDYPRPRLRRAPSLLPAPDPPHVGNLSREARRRDAVRWAARSPVERVYAATGLRLGNQLTDPAFLAAVFALPDRLGGGSGSSYHILRKCCADLLAPGSLPPRRRSRGSRYDLRLADALDRMAVELLSPDAVRERGFFDPAYVAALLRRDSGRPYPVEQIRRIWSVLLTELWARSFLDHRGSPPDHPLPGVRRLDDLGTGSGRPTGRSVPAEAKRGGA